MSDVFSYQKKWFGRCPTAEKAQNILMFPNFFHEFNLGKKFTSSFIGCVILNINKCKFPSKSRNEIRQMSILHIIFSETGCQQGRHLWLLLLVPVRPNFNHTNTWYTTWSNVIQIIYHINGRLHYSSLWAGMKNEGVSPKSPPNDSVIWVEK